MSEILFLQDVAAIMDSLTTAFDGEQLSPELKLTNAIEHLMVESGTPCPYILIFDVSAIPIYTFKTNISNTDGLYIIRAVTQDSIYSAQTIAGRIHQKIFDTLQGRQVSIDGYSKPFRFSLGQKEPTHWETVSSDERYFHSGFKWLATTS